MSDRQGKRTYDHRLVRLVAETGDPTIATRLGVPRSTAAGWVRRAPKAVVADARFDAAHADLLARVARLERRVLRRVALVRVLVALVRIAQPSLTRLRIPASADTRIGAAGAADRRRTER